MRNKLTLLVLWVVICYLFVELCALIILSTGKNITENNIFLPSKEQNIPLEVLHPYLGFVYNPEQNTPELTKYHGVPISSQGFIDDNEPLFSKKKDRVIIGVFGGSVAFWLSITGKDCLFTELRKNPDFKNKEFILVRVALGGFKQP